jgi:hypothetical protein
LAYWKRGYLYKSMRQGRKVHTVYLGKGEAAQQIAALDTIEGQERDVRRLAWKCDRARIEAADNTVAELGQLARALTAATLVANGYHNHNGHWRHRHGKRNQNKR